MGEVDGLYVGRVEMVEEGGVMEWVLVVVDRDEEVGVEVGE